MLALNPIITAAGAGGVPDVRGLPKQLRGRIDDYTHTITTTGGFESCTLPFVGTLDEAVFWLGQLMASVTVFGPDAETVWDGVLTSITVTLGQERRSVSLDKMANRIRTKYTTVLGTQRTTAAITDATSIARYGTKDDALTLSKANSTSAANYALAELNRRANPMAAPTTEIATGDLGDIKIELHAVGWYYLLDWLLTKVTTKSSAVTTEQVKNLLTSYCTVNPFISANFRRIAASGISDTQYVTADTTFRAAIENLLKQGNSNNQRLAWGVYENQQFVVNEWAGANPTNITYRRHLGSGELTNSAGARIAPWNVRPDAMYEVVDLLDVAPVAGNADGAARFYVERVTCKVSGNSIGVTLEPQASDSLDARLARLK